MTMYDEALSHTARLNVIKYSKKSQCLGPERITDLDIATRNLTGSSLVGSTELTEPLSSSDALLFSSDLATVRTIDISEAQVKELLDGFSEVNNAEDLIRMLNAPQPFDKDQNRFEISDSSVQDLFDRKISNTAKSMNQSAPDETNEDISQVTEIADMMSETQGSVHDLEIRNIMASLVSRVNQLSQKSAGPS